MTAEVAKVAPTAQLSLDQLMEVSRVMAVSTILPKALQGKPADVLITIMYGQELGMTPMQAILGIYVVNGRPGLSGQTWLARVRQAGHRVTVTDHTEKTCTVTITRGDTAEEHTETFTWADAERAKLTAKDVWKAWPKRMLLWRACTNCATVICPEVALGFEMAEAMPDPAEKPNLAQVAAQRLDQPAERPGPVDAEIVDDDAEAEEVAAALAELDTEQGLLPDDPDLLAVDGE